MKPSHEADPQAALAEIDKDAAEYHRIAERRVRLGLLLSEIGTANGVEITDQEMNRLVAQAAAQYQGADRDRFIQLVQQDPMFAAQVRAPLYEDKVVDYLFSTATVTDRTATRAQLEADLESEEGHVHGPGCGHDHAAPAKAKGKKAKAEKPAEPEAEAREGRQARREEGRRWSRRRRRPSRPSRSRANPPTSLSRARSRGRPRRR